MEISITVESFGMGWDRWKELITRLEADGYAGIYKCDHFVMGNTPPDDHLETYIALAYLACHIPRVHFGTMVSPLSFRDPVIMARQAMAIDGLSGGRMILGLGAGWMQEEHDMFGYPLGSVKERLDRFEEGLNVISQLIRSDKPVTFKGQYYQLQDAVLLPRTPTSIMIGGDGPKRTMPLVAKYADIWNCQGTIENFKQKNTLLDKLLHEAGRPFDSVKRTYAAFMACWQTDAELDKLMNDIPEKVQSFFGGREGYVKSMQDGFPTSPDDVVEHIKAFEDAGCEEFVIHYFGMNGDTQLDILAEHVLPHFH